MEALQRAIQHFTQEAGDLSKLEGHRLLEVWHQAQELKRRLLLGALDHDVDRDELNLARQILNRWRAEFKSYLIRGGGPEEESQWRPISSSGESIASKVASGNWYHEWTKEIQEEKASLEDAPDAEYLIQHPEEASVAASHLIDLILRLEELYLWNAVSPQSEEAQTNGTSLLETSVRKSLEHARALRRGWREVAEYEEARAEEERAQRVASPSYGNRINTRLFIEWLEDLEDRLDRVRDPDLAWAVLLEAMTAQVVLKGVRGQSDSPLVTINARLDWLCRQGDDLRCPDPEALAQVELRLLKRRLTTFRSLANQTLSQEDDTPVWLGRSSAEYQAVEEEKEHDREENQIWHLLQQGTLLYSKAYSIRNTDIYQSATAEENSEVAELDEICEKHLNTLQGIRANLHERIEEVADEDLERWRRDLLVEADDLLSLAPTRDPEWGSAALGVVRRDLKWFTAEYERRLNAAQIDENSAPDDEKRSPTSFRLLPRRLESLQSTLDDVIEEHRQLNLRKRLNRVLTKPGARALDLLVNVLIIVILILLGLQLFQQGLFAQQDSAYALWIEMWVDPLICAVFLFEFFLKLYLADDRRWYFRKHWFTDLIPSIPYGLIFHSATASYITALRGVRLIRVLRGLKALRLISLLQRVVDRLVRKFRATLDVGLVLFDEKDELSDRQQDTLSHLRGRFGRIADRAMSSSTNLLGEVPDHAEKFWHRQSLVLLAEVDALHDEELFRDGSSQRDLSRQVRLESVIDQLKQTDVLQIESLLGSASVDQVHRYLRLLSPLLAPTLGIHRSPRDLPPAEAIQVVARAVASRLEAILENGVHFVRDLYGIISIPEFLSFSGGFFAKMFKRQRNRLFFGIAILLISLGMIGIARQFDAYILEVKVAVPDDHWPEESEMTEFRKRLKRAVSRSEGELFIESPALSEGDTVTTYTVMMRVGQEVFDRSELKLKAGVEEAFRDVFVNGPVVVIPAESIKKEGVALRKIGRGLRNSFGAVLVIVGFAGLIFVWFGNWLMKKAGQVVDEHQRVAEAQFINLTKEFKRRYAHHDLAMLARRVLRLELPTEAVVSRDLDDVLRERLFERYDDTHREVGFLTGEEATDPEEVNDEVGAFDPAIDRITMLYLDALDGAVLHRSDVKTTEQLLGNITVLHIIERLGLSEKELKKLERLDLAKGRSLFGPYLWFTFITNSISQKVGRLVLEFNKKYQTAEFTALDALVIDAERDEIIARRFGQGALHQWRDERRRMIRSVFGTYPLQQVVLNVYSWYRMNYEGGIRIFKLPFHLVWALCKLTGMMVWRFYILVRDFVTGEETYPPPSPEASLNVAYRKINRMRRPLFMAALELRARYDLAYMDLRLPGCDFVACEEDGMEAELEEIGASSLERDRLLDLREVYARRVRRLARRRKELGLLGVAAKDDGLTKDTWDEEFSARLRAAYTEAALNPDIEALWDAKYFLNDHIAPIVQRGGWPEEMAMSDRINWAIYRVMNWRPWRRAGSNKVRQFATELYGESVTPSQVIALKRAWFFDLENFRRVLEVTTRYNCVKEPQEESMRQLREAAQDPEALHLQLVVLRTIQTLAVIDLWNYRRIVAELGEYNKNDVKNVVTK